MENDPAGLGLNVYVCEYRRFRWECDFAGHLCDKYQYLDAGSNSAN